MITVQHLAEHLKTTKQVQSFRSAGVPLPNAQTQQKACHKCSTLLEVGGQEINNAHEEHVYSWWPGSPLARGPSPFSCVEALFEGTRNSRPVNGQNVYRAKILKQNEYSTENKPDGF